MTRRTFRHRLLILAAVTAAEGITLGTWLWLTDRQLRRNLPPLYQGRARV